MKSDYSKLQKLTAQVQALGEAVATLSATVSVIQANLQMLAKVAHYHGEPEVAAKLEPNEQTNEPLPSWEKSEFQNEPT